MTRNQKYALFVRNAKACETAKHPKCTCACGGTFHGQSHEKVLGELWDAYRDREAKEIERGERLPSDAP